MSRNALIPRRPALLVRPGSVPAPGSFDLDVTAPEAPVLRVRGTLDRTAAPAARDAMYAALADGPATVVLDLTGATALDGPGAVLLVAMSRHARRLGSGLRIAGVRPEIRAVLRDRGVEALLHLQS